MVLDNVQCVKCGARFGECDCWNRFTASERRLIADIVTSSAADHLRSMYPDAYKIMPKSAWRSLRGHINNALVMEFKNLEKCKP